MKQAVATVTACAALAASAAAWSKGALEKIAIQEVGSDAVLEITDPRVLARFTIWSGPGVWGWDMATTIPAPNDAAFIIDWTKGMTSAERSAASSYRVTLYVEDRDPPCNKYEALYEVDAGGAGRVYLPRADEELGRCNMALIARDVEGNWFRASAAWDDAVRFVTNDRPR
jgi:hypothetical protein